MNKAIIYPTSAPATVTPFASPTYSATAPTTVRRTNARSATIHSSNEERNPWPGSKNPGIVLPLITSNDGRILRRVPRNLQLFGHCLVTRKCLARQCFRHTSSLRFASTFRATLSCRCLRVQKSSTYRSSRSRSRVKHTHTYRKRYRFRWRYAPTPADRDSGATTQRQSGLPADCAELWRRPIVSGCVSGFDSTARPL